MPLMIMDPRAVTRERCPVARCVTSEEHLMEKIHIERHKTEYRIDGLTLDEGRLLFHLRQKNIPRHLFHSIRRGLHTKHAVTLCRASDQTDWMILFPLSEEAAAVLVRETEG
jgi:hypothetical protein